MKSKFVKFLTVSLASSILLAPAQEAFGLGTKPQTKLIETQPLVRDRESCLGVDSKGTQNQGLVQKGKATNTSQSYPDQPLTATSQTTNSDQLNSDEQTTQLSNTVGGVTVTLLFLSYIFVGLQYRRYRAHRTTVLLQQIETLERIWKMNPRQR